MGLFSYLNWIYALIKGWHRICTCTTKSKSNKTLFSDVSSHYMCVWKPVTFFPIHTAVLELMGCNIIVYFCVSALIRKKECFFEQRFKK